MPRREYRVVECPLCHREIAALAGSADDLDGLRVVTHAPIDPRYSRGSQRRCPASGEVVVPRDGRWQLEEPLHATR